MLVCMTVLIGCAQNDVREGPKIARIVVTEDHPFDIDAALNVGEVDVGKFLAYLHTRDTGTLSTNYDKSNTVALVIGEPLPVGTQITMKYRQYAGEWVEYERTNEVVSTGSPIVFLNSYRIRRDADVTVRAILNGEEIAKREFRVRGPQFEFNGDYDLRGAQPFNETQIREFVSGNTFRFDEGTARWAFLDDGSYRRIRKGEADGLGRWRIQDGKLCVDFDNGKSRCYIIAVDGPHVYFINKRSVRYRMEMV